MSKAAVCKGPSYLNLSSRSAAAPACCTAAPAAPAAAPAAAAAAPPAAAAAWPAAAAAWPTAAPPAPAAVARWAAAAPPSCRRMHVSSRLSRCSTCECEVLAAFEAGWAAQLGVSDSRGWAAGVSRGRISQVVAVQVGDLSNWRTTKLALPAPGKAANKRLSAARTRRGRMDPMPACSTAAQASLHQPGRSAAVQTSLHQPGHKLLARTWPG